MKKLKVFTFVLSALMLQSICVNAASSKKSDEYTREEIENRRPGFYASDIAKSVQYVNSGKNTFSAKEAPSIDDEDDYEPIENYTYNQVGPISASDIVTINAIPGSSAKWEDLIMEIGYILRIISLVLDGSLLMENGTIWIVMALCRLVG